MRKQQVIALLTDFGLRDVYIASMKGVILSISPNVKIIDLTHSVNPQNVDEAAYLLWSSYRFFPRNTIFVCVVDPEVGTSRKIICVEGGGYKFLAPDNGILKFILGSIKQTKTVCVNDKKYFLAEISSTFHGRDIFAPVSGYLAKGLSVKNLGPATTPIFQAERFVEVLTKTKIEAHGKVIHIDNFGNIVTNYGCKYMDLNTLQLKIGKWTIKDYSRTYADAKYNKPFIILGSSSLLEVSVKNGSAADLLHVKINDPLQLNSE